MVGAQAPPPVAASATLTCPDRVTTLPISVQVEQVGAAVDGNAGQVLEGRVGKVVHAVDRVMLGSGHNPGISGLGNIR